MSQPARITGEVVYREGDGPNMPIRIGPCEVEQGPNDVTISWVDGDTHGLTAIPLTDFRRHLACRSIELLPAPTQMS